jgi:membrane-associated phospholipid phosphatase
MQELTLLIHNFFSGTQMAVIIAYIGEWIPYILAFFTILWMIVYAYQHQDSTFRVIVRVSTHPVISFITTFVLVAFLKQIVRIPRPEYLTPIFESSGFGFPSNHSAFMGAWIGSFWVHMNIPLKILSILLVIFVCLSRVVAGVHSAFDILIGFTLGLGISWLLKNSSKSYRIS